MFPRHLYVRLPFLGHSMAIERLSAGPYQGRWFDYARTPEGHDAEVWIGRWHVILSAPEDGRRMGITSTAG